MKRYVLNTDLFEDEFYIKGSRYNKEPKWSGHIEIDEKDYLDFIAEQTTRFITYLKDSIRSVNKLSFEEFKKHYGEDANGNAICPNCGITIHKENWSGHCPFCDFINYEEDN